MTNEQKIVPNKFSEILTTLRQGRANIEKGWTRMAFMRGEQKQSLVPECRDLAVCYCTAGAARCAEMDRINSNEDTPEYYAALVELAKQIGINQPALIERLITAKYFGDNVDYANPDRRLALELVAYWNDHVALLQREVIGLYTSTITRLEAANG